MKSGISDILGYMIFCTHWVQIQTPKFLLKKQCLSAFQPYFTIWTSRIQVISKWGDFMKKKIMAMMLATACIGAGTLNFATPVNAAEQNTAFIMGDVNDDGVFFDVNDDGVFSVSDVVLLQDRKEVIVSLNVGNYIVVWDASVYIRKERLIDSRTVVGCAAQAEGNALDGSNVILGADLDDIYVRHYAEYKLGVALLGENVLWISHLIGGGKRCVDAVVGLRVPESVKFKL